VPFQKFGRYEVKSELGRGGMATVYLGWDPRFRREVAIKVLPREFLHDPQFLARFEREAQTIALLDHPAIVPVHDFGEEDGLPYLVMRLMTGGSLATRLKQGPVLIAEASRILNRLAPALDEAHARGVIHRDLKPGNILFDQRGDPYLSDFGIVKLTEGAASFTGSGLIGTPAYMSPEQVRGEGRIDGRSDIYALGVILFEMLAGKQPYEATTPIGVAFKHVTEPVPRVLDVKPELPLDAQAVIERAMAKAPEDRYQTAGGMASALAAIASRDAVLPKTIPTEVILPATTGHTLSGETVAAEPEPETREHLPAPALPLTAPPAIPEVVAAPPGPVVAPVVGLPEAETAPLEAPVAEAVALPPEAGTPVQAASPAEAAPEASENRSGLADLTGLEALDTEACPTTPKLTAEFEPMTRTPTVITPPAQPMKQRAPRALARFALPAAGLVVIVLLIVGGAIFGPRVFNTAAATPTVMSAAIVEASPSLTLTPSPSPTLPSTPSPTVTPTRTPRPTITPTPLPAGEESSTELITAFAEPILAAIAGQKPDFQDDFSTRAGGWTLEEWCANRARVEIENGEMTVSGACRGVWREMWYPDFVAEMDARFLPGVPPDSYWVFNYRRSSVVPSPNNWYMFYFSGDVIAALLSSRDGVENTPLQSVALPGTNVNHVRMIAKGQAFALYINDRPTFYKLGEPVWPNGGMGMEIQGAVAFDNFKVWDISDLPLAPTSTPRPTNTPTPLPDEEKTSAELTADFVEPILAAIANQTPDFQDDFSTRAGGWTKADWCADWRLKYVDGEMVVSDCHVERKMSYLDFVAEMDARFLPGSPPDSQWRFHYRRGLSPGGGAPYFFDFKYSGDVGVGFEELGSPGKYTDYPDAARPGLSSNHVLIIVKDQAVALFVNNRPTHYGALPILWKNGGMEWSFGDTVAFDNFKIWDISDLSLTTTPTPRPAPARCRAAPSGMASRSPESR